jgi:hypothetical protein
MKTKLFVAFAIMCIGLFCAGCARKGQTTEWTEWYPCGLAEDKNCIDPGFYGEAGPPPIHSYLPSKEVGLRSDGVIVWRERKKSK